MFAECIMEISITTFTTTVRQKNHQLGHGGNFIHSNGLFYIGGYNVMGQKSKAIYEYKEGQWMRWPKDVPVLNDVRDALEGLSKYMESKI